MDEHNNDPYEQQLRAVFQSCLRKDQKELHEDDWLVLCRKLHLAERSEELRLCIQRRKQEKSSISFSEFRTALLTLLDKEQAILGHGERIEPSHLGAWKSGIQGSQELEPVFDVHNTKAELSEDTLKCLWEKLCLKEEDFATVHFASDILGIPTLPKQVTQCIFEKLDQNSDGLINLDEFFVIFQRKESSMGKNKSLQNLGNVEASKCSFDMLTYRPLSRKNSVSDMWQVSGVANISTLLSHTGLDTSDVSLADITATLCDELKGINESLDNLAIRSHVTLLRDTLLLHQDKLHKMSITIENMSCEREKLRSDIGEANERVNSLVQELDEQHVRAEELKQTLRKQLEQRYADTIQDLSNQLNSERENTSTNLKAKEEQIQTLQKENYELRNKYTAMFQENQSLEMENEALQGQIDMLKQSNNELFSQMKILAAEHDEAESAESKQQQEVMCLIDRIKQLQTEIVYLRDQNDELTIELETSRSRDDYNKSLRNEMQSNPHLMRSGHSDEAEDKNMFSMDEEPELDILLKHSTPTHCSEKSDPSRIPSNRDSRSTLLIQLKEILANTKCSSECCAFRSELSSAISQLESNRDTIFASSVNNSAIQREDFAKSIACELEIECEERTSESLRDLVVPKQKNLVAAKRVFLSDSNSDLSNESEELSACGQEAKNRRSTLRDYPPRKEEGEIRSTREKETSLDVAAKGSTETGKNCGGSASFDGFEERVRELEAVHANEKKQLSEQCLMLEKSLDLLKLEYEESENYWAAKLEEERQLFEQEQKISDEKFTELIAKMTEYEELITADEGKNGRLSPIEEKFHLEQQYMDLEEEYEKCQTKMCEELQQKDNEIKLLQEKLKSLLKPPTVDISIQVTDDEDTPDSFDSTFAPITSISAWSSSIEKEPRQQSQTDKVPEDLKLEKILENSRFSDEFAPQKLLAKEPPKDDALLRRNVAARSSVLVKEEPRHDVDYDLLQNGMKMQQFRQINCHCVQGNVCCVDVSILQNLSLRLQIQERKKHQLQKYIKRQHQHVEHVLHRILSEHQIEVTELQYLLRTTQEKLQMQFQTCAEQAEKLARADILVKELYLENACLIGNMKRLEQHCHILSEFDVESTSI